MSEIIQFPQGGMAAAFRAPSIDQDSLGDGIGASYPVIRYKGKVWSLQYRGQKYNLKDDRGFESPYLDVVILRSAAVKSKSFYKKYTPGQSDGERPLCSSMDGVRPDPDVPDKQAEACAICPRNVWKTDPQTGRKGRDCTDYKRLAVLIWPTMTQPLLGQPLMEPAFLRVPPASLTSLATMGEEMDHAGFHYMSYVTRITFDPNEAHPKMVFRFHKALTDADAPSIIALRNQQVTDRIVNGDIVLDEKRLAASKAPLLEGVVQPPQACNLTPQITGVHPPLLSTVGDANNLGDPKVPGVAVPAVPTLAPGEAGVSEESNADMDARIAALIHAGK